MVVPPIPGQELAGQELIAAMAGVHGVIAGDDQFTREVMQQLPDLKAISKWGIGLDGIDLDAAAELGITVTNTPGMFNDEVAEIALGYLIASVRGIVATDRAVRRGEWRNPVGRSLRDKHVVVVGVGNIGLAFCLKAQALGMRVSGVEPGQAAAETATAQGIAIGELDSLLTTADIVVITCPLNPGTLALINAERLALALKSSILSSTSFQMGKTFWEGVSAAVEQLSVEPTWLLRETGTSALEADPRIPPNQKNATIGHFVYKCERNLPCYSTVVYDT